MGSSAGAGKLVSTLGTSVIKAVKEPSWNHAFVTFNNQDSVLMTMNLPDDNLLCFLHDNRVFAFRNGNNNSADNDADADDAGDTGSAFVGTTQNMILNLLTTPKYRAMSAMYLLFRLLDNSILLLLLVLSCLNTDFKMPTPSEVALLSTIGIEIFYDVMLCTHRYWILHRLSIHIGLVLYAIYGGIVVWNDLNGVYKDNELTTVVAFLVARFTAFMLEECVDIAIDGAVHNDLLKLSLQRRSQQLRRQGYEDLENGGHAVEIEMERLVASAESPSGIGNTGAADKITFNTGCNCTRYLYEKYRSYMDVANIVKMPESVEYMGSFFAWLPYSVFDTNVWGQNKFPHWMIRLLCFLPFIFTVLILMVIMVLCVVALLIPIMVGYTIVICSNYCTCYNNNGDVPDRRPRISASNFWKELTHF